MGFHSGAAAGQTVPHVHVHVIPRYSGDMTDPRGGVRHVIPEQGNYLVGPAASARLSLTTSPDRPRRFIQKPGGLPIRRAGSSLSGRATCRGRRLCRVSSGI
ncbi:MAG: HIT domain-containing protein [Planctomycetota bacterium]